LALSGLEVLSDTILAKHVVAGQYDFFISDIASGTLQLTLKLPNLNP
jgi:hypothetical protein